MISMNNQDTIIAQATPKGKSGIGIIRISGSRTFQVAKFILGKIPKPRHACYSKFLDKNKKIIDQGIAILFPKPNSFTGEDVLELQGHGSQLIINIIITNIIKLPGVRIAKPGEFAERAFLNNKIDLIQAEAIIDLINASSEKGAKAAMCSLQGNFSKLINNLLKKITNIRMFIEASIDFPDEEIDFYKEKKIQKKLKLILKTINCSIKEAKNIRKAYEGIKLVIVGNTNVGKSSLMNILTGKKTSIITNIAGTTRDVVREFIDIKKSTHCISLHMSDTAGFRKTNNLIESIGIKLAYKEIKVADHVLYMFSKTKHNKADEIINNFFYQRTYKINKNITLICNKIDLVNEKSRVEKIKEKDIIFISSLTGEGIKLLKNYLVEKFYFNKPDTGNNFLARYRHIQSLEKVKKSITRGIEFVSEKNIKVELLAEELRLSQKFLGEITGKFTSEHLLANIFSSFCIGK